jgi:hypothetical protein
MIAGATLLGEKKKHIVEKGEFTRIPILTGLSGQVLYKSTYNPIIHNRNSTYMWICDRQCFWTLTARIPKGSKAGTK